MTLKSIVLSLKSIKVSYKILSSILLYALFGMGLLIIYLLFLSPHHRLYQVSAESEYVKLKLSDSIQNRWDVSSFEICERKEVEFNFENEVQISDSAQLQCLPYKKAQEKLLQINPNTSATVFWSMAQGLQVELSSPASVGVLIRTSKEPLSLGSTVLLHRKIGGTSPLTLTFEGEIQIGSEAKLGQENLLRSGVVQVFEKVKIFGKKYLLGEIELSMGDAITFVQQESNQALSIVKGFLRVSSEEAGYEKGIYIIAYTAASDRAQNNSLQVTRFGTEGYIFSPTIWNRIQADPFISLFITIFGALLLILELLSKWKERNND